MSVLIKGMELPKNCDMCPLADTIICGAQGCPLIEVPPHGRLIDADAQIEAAIEYSKRAREVYPFLSDAELVVTMAGLKTAIQLLSLNMPTIIEAEEAL